jgi:large subunit ribosomal protein L1
MPKIGKRLKSVRERLGDVTEERSAEEALSLLKELTSVKFDESVDVAINLGIDPKKSDQVVRGSTVLPHGLGKTIRIALFADGPDAEAGAEAGADVVGMDDLADDIKKGNINFDLVIATPSSMRIVGQLGQILGPKGLMPNPKVGTVSSDVATAVRNAKAGQAQFRADKNGIVHCSIGKASFTTDALKENLEAVLGEVRKSKPSSSKGVYMQAISLSTTMGPGVLIDKSSIAAIS